MQKLYVMCGVPGSGKSTFIEENLSEYVFVVSPNRIRETMLGDINNQDHNPLVFQIAFERMRDALIDGYDVTFDATNVKEWNRANILANIPDEVQGKLKKICIYMATPYKMCIERNDKRGRVVPHSVIKRMDHSLNKPMTEEGFDEVWSIHEGSY